MQITPTTVPPLPQSAPPLSLPAPLSAPDDAYIPGQVLVKLRRPLEASTTDMPQRLGGCDVLRRFVIPAQMHAAFGGALYLVETAEGTSVPQAIETLSRDPDVVYAEPNWRIEADERVPDDLDDRLWGMSNHGQTAGTPGADIHAPKAWAKQTGKRISEGGPLVAVIDTGIDYTHPDLAANIWTNPDEIAGNGLDDDHDGIVDDVHGADFLLHSGDPRDTTRDGHGTHVAGTIGAVGDNGVGVVGVSWRTTMMGLRFLHDYGGSADGAIEAILYATRMGARIVNNSWGLNKPSQALYDAIKASPALHVCAAGNRHRDIDAEPHYPAAYDLPNILTVAATDDHDRLTRISNYGKTSVDLAAPGLDILSTVPNGEYAFKSGTSMATPHVTGVAALVLAQHPELTTQQLKQRLMQTVDHVPGLEGRTVTGGRLNAAAAVL